MIPGVRSSVGVGWLIGMSVLGSQPPYSTAVRLTGSRQAAR